MTQEERIERYFSGEMDDLERLAFDKEVMSDEKLAIAVKEYRRILQGVKTYGLQQKLGRLMEETSLLQNESNVTSSRRKSLWIYVAFAAILAGAIYFLILAKSPNTEAETAPQLYMAYYYPDPGLPTRMGNNDDFDFDRGMVDYKLGAYKKAIEQWEDLSAIDARVKYYLGAAYLADNNVERATPFFEGLTKEDEFYDRSQWYLSLIALKKDDIDSSIEHLNSILQLKQSPYQERAQKLLNELSN